MSIQGSIHAGGPTSVGMVPQGSHQGTNPSAGATPGGSASASPSMTNKRRRASAVGVGGGDEEMVNGVGGVGGKGIKPSPRIGGKRQKANG